MHLYAVRFGLLLVAGVRPNEKSHQRPSCAARAHGRSRTAASMPTSNDRPSQNEGPAACTGEPLVGPPPAAGLPR